MFWPIGVYAVFCVFWAYANARTIDSDGYIHHWANFILHFTCCCALGVLAHWTLGFAAFFMGRSVFDSFLGIFRKKGWAYVSPDPKSWFDIQEIRLFGQNGALPKICYLVVMAGFLYLRFIQ